jgi:hypothetical protein
MKRFAWQLILALACWLAVPAWAHVGSPNIFFEGEAGAYPVRVTIRPPRVVPGLAEISVRVNTNGISKVSVLPARWDTGRKGSPPPDVCALVPGETNLYSAQLWLMDSGAYSVFVNVDGAAGTGTAIVPVNAVATVRLDMPRWMSSLFLALGLILFVTLAALVGSAVREGSLPAGAPVEPRFHKRGRVATGITVAVASALLFIGKAWWDSVDRDFRYRRLYKPVTVASSIDAQGRLVITPGDGAEREVRQDTSPLVPDHGKLMHLFLIEEKTGRGFAHLHPIRQGAREFVAALPALPSGKYHVYADITRETGFTETMVSEVVIPEKVAATGAELDPDDAFAVGGGSMKNGATISWDAKPGLKVNEETTLRFTARKADGSLALLEPYLGMYAHGVIWKRDGSVFTHLHPLGTISMTSQLLFARREEGARMANQPLDIVCGAPPKEVSFPFAFPEAGEYRVWVQVRIDGEIQTAAFDATIL